MTERYSPATTRHAARFDFEGIYFRNLDFPVGSLLHLLRTCQVSGDESKDVTLDNSAAIVPFGVQVIDGLLSDRLKLSRLLVLLFFTCHVSRPRIFFRRGRGPSVAHE